MKTPDTRIPERNYILDVVFREFLGLPWRRESASGSDVRITLLGQIGELRLPDILLNTGDSEWLTPASMPARPLLKWNSDELDIPINVTDQIFPVIYGDQNPKTRRSQNAIRLPVDIFGSTFFMLSRYEELITVERDEHDRFPAWASTSLQEGFLDRPIVDEYIEILWRSMKYLWPQLERKPQHFSIKVSHDVDNPSFYGFMSYTSLFRNMAGNILKRGDVKNAFRTLSIRISTRRRLHAKDPANTFDWIMDVSTRNGLTSAFYFICGQSHPRFDANYKLEHPAIRDLIRKIHNRGHEVGLHPSYNTYKSPASIVFESKRLKKVCAEEGVKQKTWGGRMHYLRWEHPKTLYGWEQAGFDYDSTLGFADYPGFRCGTCFEYPAFDPAACKQIDIRIRPLIAMDRTIMSPLYLGLGITEGALRKLTQLKSACRKMNGTFTILWHNTELISQDLREFYEGMLQS